MSRDEFGDGQSNDQESATLDLVRASALAREMEPLSLYGDASRCRAGVLFDGDGLRRV